MVYIKQLARAITERIVTNAISGQWTRNISEAEDSAVVFPTEEILVKDALALAFGDDIGCLDEEDDDFRDKIDLYWLEDQLEKISAMTTWQPMMVGWVKSRLGESAMEPRERDLRFGEESIELLQAVGLSALDILRLLVHVYGKKPGRVGQEIGGVVTTLLTLAQSHDADMNICALMEIDRIHALPPEKFQNRQRKNAEGGIGIPPGM